MTDPCPPFILGVTVWQPDLRVLAHPDLLLRAGDLAFLASEMAETPPQRLRRQMGWCRAGIDFLPISPRAPLSLSAAQGLVETQGQALRNALARLTGQIEVIVQCGLATVAGHDLPEVGTETGGQAWLRRRAGRLAAHMRAAEILDRALAHLLDELIAPEGWRSLEVSIPSDAQTTRLRRAVLLPRWAQEPFGAALARKIAAEKWTGAWDLLAPLPPLNFATLEGTA